MGSVTRSGSLVGSGAIAQSTGASSANRAIKTDATGRLHKSLLPSSVLFQPAPDGQTRVVGPWYGPGGTPGQLQIQLAPDSAGPQVAGICFLGPDGSLSTGLYGSQSNTLCLDSRSGSTRFVNNDEHVVEIDSQGLTMLSGILRCPGYAVAEVPAPTNKAGAIAYITNDAGGPTIAFSDGTNWRRLRDNQVIAMG